MPGPQSAMRLHSNVLNAIVVSKRCEMRIVERGLCLVHICRRRCHHGPKIVAGYRAVPVLHNTIDQGNPPDDPGADPVTVRMIGPIRMAYTMVVLLELASLLASFGALRLRSRLAKDREHQGFARDVQ